MSAINEAIERIKGRLLVIDYYSHLDIEMKENERDTGIIRENLAIIMHELAVRDRAMDLACEWGNPYDSRDGCPPDIDECYEDEGDEREMKACRKCFHDHALAQARDELAKEAEAKPEAITRGEALADYIARLKEAQRITRETSTFLGVKPEGKP